MKKNSRNKAPAFQFYAADWLTDPSLRLCSAETRGVWIDLLCLMFLSEDKGFLTINGVVLDPGRIQKLSGISSKRFKNVFNELTSFGILKQDEKGCYYSKRMAEDAALSLVRKESGSKGGNPNLINKEKKVEVLVNQKVKEKDKQNPTPSTSTSTSISLIVNNKHYLHLFIKENCLNVSKLKNQLTFEECLKLEANFKKEIIEEVLFSMENFKQLTTKYSSVYLTLTNWIKRRQNESNQSNIKPNKEDALRDF